jgi:hypothetical protein
MTSEERFEHTARLLKAGIPVLEADALIDACEENRELVLVLHPLPGAPRVGDRLRVKLGDGEETRVALEVERCHAGVPVTIANAPCTMYAIVGRPVQPGRRDDVATDAPVRRARL